MPHSHLPNHKLLFEAGVALSSIDPMDVARSPLSSDAILESLMNEHAPIRAATIPLQCLYTSQWPELIESLASFPDLAYLAFDRQSPSHAEGSTCGEPNAVPWNVASWLSTLPKLRGVTFMDVRDVSPLSGHPELLSKLLVFGARRAKVRQRDLEWMGCMRQLQSLDLEGCEFDCSVGDFFTNVRSLLFLSLENAEGLTADDIAQVRHLSLLRCLNLAGICSVADAVKLRRDLPDCYVMHDRNIGRCVAPDSGQFPNRNREI